MRKESHDSWMMSFGVSRMTELLLPADVGYVLTQPSGLSEDGHCVSTSYAELVFREPWFRQRKKETKTQRNRSKSSCEFYLS